MVRHSNCATFYMSRSLHTRLLEVIFLPSFLPSACCGGCILWCAQPVSNYFRKTQITKNSYHDFRIHLCSFIPQLLIDPKRVCNQQNVCISSSFLRRCLTARHLFAALYLQFVTSSNKNNRNLLSYNKSILHKPRLPYLIWINYYTMQHYQMLLANLEISEY